MHGDYSVEDLRPSQMDRIVCAHSDTAAMSKYRSSGSNKVIRASKAAADGHSSPAVSEDILQVLVAGNKGLEPERNTQECCMCGDIGLTKDLFRCCKCQHRLQHTYCSNWYPKKRSYAGVCNWCARDDERRRKQAKVQTHPHNICGSNENQHIQTSKLDKSSTRRCSKDQQSDVTKPRINRWRNELEMLLDAAAVTDVADAKTSTSDTQTDHACKQDLEVDQGMTVSTNCKVDQPSSLSKKIVRRYKSVLDVY